MKKRSRESIFIDLTSLIDVVFLLLIFFMVSTVFKKNDYALSINLPKSDNDKKTSQVSKNKKISIELSKQKLALNGKVTSVKDFSIFLSKVGNKKILINFRIDKQVKYQKIVTILDLLQKNNLNNIALISKK